MDRLDGYLSRLCQQVWPAARVLERAGQFILDRPGEAELILGDRFQSARQAVAALLHSERARKGAADECR